MFVDYTEPAALSIPAGLNKLAVCGIFLLLSGVVAARDQRPGRTLSDLSVLDLRNPRLLIGRRHRDGREVPGLRQQCEHGHRVGPG